MKAVIISAAIVFTGGAAAAEPCLLSESLPAGGQAKCDGILVPRDWVLSLLKDKTERRRLEEVLKAKTAQYVQQAAACESQVTALRSALDYCSEQASKLHCPAVPWYESTPFLLTAGALVGGGIGVGVTYLVK